MSRKQIPDAAPCKLTGNKKTVSFEFTLDITWKLEGEKITITYQVKNTDDKKMYFGIGGHPGFQIPIEKNLKFEDYRIDFGEDPKPRRILFRRTVSYWRRMRLLHWKKAVI
mgnify:CR=1 FL=1